MLACSGDTAVAEDTSLDTAGSVDAAVLVDGGLVSPRTLCEGIAVCVPSLDVEACVAAAQAELDRVSALGCAATASGANACTLSIYRAGPSGTCMPDAFACDAPYRAHNECVVAATGIAEFSCDARTSASTTCTTYAGSGLAPAATCASLSAMAVASCPVDTAAGRCVLPSAGGVTLTVTYYPPLPSGLTVMTLQDICERGTGGGAGTWTTF